METLSLTFVTSSGGDLCFGVGPGILLGLGKRYAECVSRYPDVLLFLIAARIDNDQRVRCGRLGRLQTGLSMKQEEANASNEKTPAALDSGAAGYLIRRRER